MAPERPSSEENAGYAIAHVFSMNANVIQVKEEEGSFAEEPIVAEDDDLTSLSWLVQNKNLLKGINLKPGVAQTSPTSDFAEDGSSGSDRSERADSTCSSGISQTISPGPGPGPGANGVGNITDIEKTPTNTSKLKHPHHIPYDPMIHVTSKPPYSFSCLIFMAIEDSPARALPVKEIYAWIQSHFPFYRNAPTGWKNSVRHNLSLNKCFCKVEKAPNLGKGSLWMVDPAFRPNLLQSMSKAPLNSLSFLDRCAANSTSTLVGPDLKSNGSGKSMNGSSTKSLGKLSRLPNPELFPFLSRRLAASGVELPGVGRYGDSVDGDSEDDDEDADDVDAATAMLTLKHGPRVILPKNDDIYKRSFARKLNSQRTRKSSTNTPVITSSPSEDHTYSAGPNMSPDEAYGEGSDTDDGTEITPGHPSLSDEAVQSDSEEQRRIAEGAADALLNLAGFRSKPNVQVDGARGRQRPSQQSDDGSIAAKRARHQRKPSNESNSPRPQLLRSNRKREKIAMEQEILERKNITKAEILADLEVIRNNNNNSIVGSISCAKDDPASAAAAHTRSFKMKRQLLLGSKLSSEPSNLSSSDLGSTPRQLPYERKVYGAQKRKPLLLGDSSARKGRR